MNPTINGVGRLLISNVSNPLGILSSEKLRKKLRKAMQAGDKENLESVINECVAAGMPELDSPVQRARKLFEDLKEMPKKGGLISSLLPLTYYV